MASPTVEPPAAALTTAAAAQRKNSLGTTKTNPTTHASSILDVRKNNTKNADPYLEFETDGAIVTANHKAADAENALHNAISTSESKAFNDVENSTLDSTFEQLRQKRRLAKMTFILFLPIAIAILQCASLIHQGLFLRRIGSTSQQTLAVAVEVAQLINSMHEEAGRTAVWLVSQSATDLQLVTAAQKAANDSLESVKQWYGEQDPQSTILFQNSVAFHVYLHLERLDTQNYNKWNLVSYRDPIQWHRDATTEIYNWLHNYTSGVCEPEYCNRAITCPYYAYLYFLGVESSLAEQRAFGTVYLKILETPAFETGTLAKYNQMVGKAATTPCASCPTALRVEQVFIKLSYKQNQALRSSLLKLANICDIDQLRGWSATDTNRDTAIATFEANIMTASNFDPVSPAAVLPDVSYIDPATGKKMYVNNLSTSSDRFWQLITERISAYAAKRSDLQAAVFNAAQDRIHDGSVLFVITVVLLVLTLLLCPPLSAWYIFTVHRITVEIWGFRQSLRDQGKTIEAERRMADQLLYQMIPKPVADELKLHKKVAPCEYESVTLFFSDVVSFTKISSQSTPMEVVDMLNQMYTVCDAVIEKYDVYKVETIGDAYMVVSGAPNRNGMHHASEICRMSLELRYCMSLFHIPHMPDKIMLIRTGIHTGSVVAGVVGKKAPRYCLFGENVTFASRMESSGEPMKLHISSRTKEFLDSIGEFETEPRMRADGQPFTIFFQGANEDTYWLIGCQNFPYRAELAESVEIAERNMP